MSETSRGERLLASAGRSGGRARAAPRIRNRARRTSRTSRVRARPRGPGRRRRPSRAGATESGSSRRPRRARASVARGRARRETTIRIRIGFGSTTTSPTIISSPTNQKAGCSAPAARPPSSGTIGMRLKRLRKNPTNASPMRSSEPVASAGDPARRRADRAQDRPGERDARLLPGVVGELLHPDHRAEERDEQRRARGNSLPPQLEDVPELVDEDQQHEADREREPPEPRVRGDRHEHREPRRDDLELEQEPAELDDQEAERDRAAQRACAGGRRAPTAASSARSRARRPRRAPARGSRRLRRVDRLVAAVGSWSDRPPPSRRLRPASSALRRYDPPPRLGPIDSVMTLPIHSSPPTYVSFFQSGTDTFSSSIASRQAASAAARCGAETAMTTLVSPISTRPTRWWIATLQSSWRRRARAARSAMTCSAMPS